MADIVESGFDFIGFHTGRPAIEFFELKTQGRLMVHVFEKAVLGKCNTCFPPWQVDAVPQLDEPREIREYYIPDFSGWERDHVEYQREFEKLGGALKAVDSD